MNQVWVHFDCPFLLPWMDLAVAEEVERAELVRAELVLVHGGRGSV